MKRRKILAAGLTLGAVAAAGSLGYAKWMQETRLGLLSLPRLIVKLESLENREITSNSLWSPGQIFAHCAQSVNYSMTGFPVHKSESFKSTLGTVAFAAFSLAGKMKHDLAETIPGAPAFDASIDTATAIRQLIASLQTFEAFGGQLAPHFAFGELTKADYALAHAMHIDNHFDELTIIDARG